MGDGSMTIDELAQRAGCTARSIRNYQTFQLLPPPTVVGRIGYYGQGHLARLRLIARLQEQGFSLAGIRELFRAWEKGGTLGEILGFEQALTAPWSDEEPELRTAEELAAMFPAAAQDAELVRRALVLHLIEVEGDRLRVPSPMLLRTGAELAAVGVPIAAALDELAALRDDVERIAARFGGLFERYVWEPFVDAGLPAERLPDVTDALRRMRPLAAGSVRALLALALERHAAEAVAAQAKVIADVRHAPRRKVSP